MAVQLQWDLGQSSTSVLSVARGIFQAATTDNVQPLALMACEKFGNTLAICSETCTKVERTVAVTPKPAVVRFLQATVGYSMDDCAIYLSKSLAGLQFLSLAAALVTSMNLSHASISLDQMLRDSATDKTLLPTRGQLQTLLGSLDGRCQSAGFADTVIGWQIMLDQLGFSSPPLHGQPRILNKNQALGVLPPPDGISKLVDLFRQLRRVGDASMTGASIHATACAPWVIAFTKWCLGIPPSLLQQDGKIILEQSGSQVTVILDPSSSRYYDFDISIQHTIGSPTELLLAQSSPDAMWSGMISVSSLAKYRMQDYGFTTSESLYAIKEACAYTLGKLIRKSNLPPLKEGKDDGIVSLQTNLFPKEGDILRALTICLGDDTPLAAFYWKDQDLPNTSSHRLKHPATTYDFESRISEIAVIILLVSLFQQPEKMLVHSNFFSQKLTKAFGKHARDDNPSNLLAGFGLQDVLSLIGHKNNHDAKLPWVMSCNRGQAVYPAILESNVIGQRGSFSLVWMKGNLQYKGDNYECVRSAALLPRPERPALTLDKRVEVLGPCNLFPDLQLDWKVTPSDKDLHITLGIRKGHSTMYHSGVDPNAFLDSLADAVFAEVCPHPRSTKLARPDQNCVFAEPGFSDLHLERSNVKNNVADVYIFPVDGSQSMRFLTLVMSGGWGRRGRWGRLLVIRKDACLGCCIALCRKLGRNFLLL